MTQTTNTPPCSVISTNGAMTSHWFQIKCLNKFPLCFFFFLSKYILQLLQWFNACLVLIWKLTCLGCNDTPILLPQIGAQSKCLREDVAIGKGYNSIWRALNPRLLCENNSRHGCYCSAHVRCAQWDTSTLITLITSAGLGLCAGCHQACCQVITKRQRNEQLDVTLSACESV